MKAVLSQVSQIFWQCISLNSTTLPTSLIRENGQQSGEKICKNSIKTRLMGNKYIVQGVLPSLVYES